MIYYKTNEEIELMRMSNQMVGRTLGLVGEMLKPGVTGESIDKAAEEFIRDNKGIPGFKGLYGFPSTLCVSLNDCVVHGIPTKKQVFKDGDIVSVDCGVILNEFYGDCAYTFAVGDVDEAIMKLLRITNESLYKGIEQAIVGKRLGDISYAIQSYAEKKHGYGIVKKLVGHGVGKELHEDPEVPNFGKRGRGIKLKEGLVIAIEPMVNMGTRDVEQMKDGWTILTKDRKPSAHFEHSVAIRKGKADILSTHEYVEAAIKNNQNLKEISTKSQIFAVQN
jgi:methionyl aminopeptidase